MWFKLSSIYARSIFASTIQWALTTSCTAQRTQCWRVLHSRSIVVNGDYVYFSVEPPSGSALPAINSIKKRNGTATNAINRLIMKKTRLQTAAPCRWAWRSRDCPTQWTASRPTRTSPISTTDRKCISAASGSSLCRIRSRDIGTSSSTRTTFDAPSSSSWWPSYRWFGRALRWIIPACWCSTISSRASPTRRWAKSWIDSTSCSLSWTRSGNSCSDTKQCWLRQGMSSCAAWKRGWRISANCRSISSSLLKMASRIWTRSNCWHCRICNQLESPNLAIDWKSCSKSSYWAVRSVSCISYDTDTYILFVHVFFTHSTSPSRLLLSPLVFGLFYFYNLMCIIHSCMECILPSFFVQNSLSLRLVLYILLKNWPHVFFQ